MNEIEYINTIEMLNKQVIELQMSKEYKNGLRLKHLVYDIKNMKFNDIISKHMRRRKLKKIRDTESCNDKMETINDNAPLDNVKIVVYSCVTGAYDSLIEPMYFRNNIDYIMFTDNENLPQKTGWKIRKIPQNLIKMGDSMLINRYIKMHSAELFRDEEYDYSIYIDGNIRVVSDLSSMIRNISKYYGVAFFKHGIRNSIFDEIQICKIIGKGNPNKLEEQSRRYKKKGMPDDYGMLECNIFVVDLKNEMSNDIMNCWWEEFYTSQSGRDQISLPYVLWKKRIPINAIGTLGNDMHTFAKVQLCMHNR